MKISDSLRSHNAGKMPPMKRLAFLVVLMLLGCRKDVAPVAVPAGRGNAAPTNVELLAYLEDKPLPLPKSGGQPHLIHLEGIEALSVRRDSVRSDGGLWRTGISFIYNTSRARYAIEAVVVHQTIGAQCVFHALRLQRVVAV
jgi:hypothetical protein